MNSDKKSPSQMLLEKASLEIRRLRAEFEKLQNRHSEPVAIVGMACRFPQAANPEEFWRVFAEGKETIGETSQRWKALGVAAGANSLRWAGLLDDVQSFEPEFFGISPREAVKLDPQQRLTLEVAYEALQRAGYPSERLVGSLTGVYIGTTFHDYEHLLIEANQSDDLHALTGSQNMCTSGRVSYVMGLQGPAMSVDTACSSSLVAVHLACQGLRNGDCNLALAGGVTLYLSPTSMDMVAQLQGFAADGRCKTFDSRADGYVRSEGCGIVALKRLSHAQRDGDNILAVIRGSAVNQDGHSAGITAPNVVAQIELLRHALANAGLQAEDMGYLEAHGTGTPLGDPIEMDAIREVFGKPRGDRRPCYVGSGKTNIGHMEAAAGIAGLLKIVLSLQHERIPKHLHFESLNPRINLTGTPLTIPTHEQPWPRGTQARYAGVSSFGMSGTNAHVILQEPPIPAVAATLPEAQPHLLTLSGRTPQGLKAVAAQSAQFLEGRAFSVGDMRDLAYTASVRRSHLAHRLVVSGNAPEEWLQALKTFVNGEEKQPHCVVGSVSEAGRRPQLAFVFSGQGSQWVGMGRELYERERVFKESIDACDTAVKAETQWSVVEELYADAKKSRLEDDDVVQPMIFAMQVSLAALWKSWDIIPDAIMGHSMGEIAAACVAGAIDLATAAKIITLRSRLFARLRGMGGMVLVDMSQSEAEEILREYPGKLGIASFNSDRALVLSGDADALRDLIEKFKKREVFWRMVRTKAAGHSHHIEQVLPDLLRGLGSMQHRTASLPFYSTVTGKLMPDGHDAAYWGRNFREPVRFVQTLREVVAAGPRIFLEISPHPVLITGADALMKTVGGELAEPLVSVASLRRAQPERQTMLEQLGALHAHGYTIAFEKLFSEAGSVQPLPTYPWQRQRYWVTAKAGVSRPRADAVGAHPLLGKRFTVASHPTDVFWQTELTEQTVGYLKDHRVGESAVLPAAAYVEMMLSAARQTFDPGTLTLEDVAFHDMIVLTDAPVRVQLALSERTSTKAFLRISTQRGQGWQLHASGSVRWEAARQPVNTGNTATSDGGNAVEPATIYKAFDALDMHYSSAFRGIERALQYGTHLRAQIRAAGDAESYAIHPAQLDAAMQAMAVPHLFKSPQGGDAVPYLPTKISRVTWYAPTNVALRVHSETIAASTDTAWHGHLQLADDTGRVALELQGVTMQRMSRGGTLPLALHHRWSPLPPVNLSTVPAGNWIVIGDGGEVGEPLTLALKAAGARVERLAAQPSLRTDLAALVAQLTPCRGVVYLASLDAPAAASSADALSWAQALVCDGVVATVNALTEKRPQQVPRLYLVASNTQLVDDAETGVVAVEQGPLWGLARVLAYEAGELRPTCVDLRAQAGLASLASPLAQTLLADENEDEMALRAEGTCYGRRLTRHLMLYPRATPLTFRKDATYLITGGLGALGLSAAKSLAERGAGHIVLMGRTGIISAQQQAAVKELSTSGATVHVLQGNVAEYTDMSRIFATVQRDMPPLAGVIHAAGILEDATVATQDAGKFARVMAPKVRGSWHLHTLTTGQDLDFFVMYSAVAGFIGSPGQSNYAAANAFMDALAVQRRTMGLPALSIQWGPFEGAGLAAVQDNRGARLADRGMRNLSMGEHADQLMQLLTYDVTNVAIVHLDAQQWARSYPHTGVSSRFIELLNKEGWQSGQKAAADAAKHRLDALIAASGAQRITLMESLVREQLADVAQATQASLGREVLFKTLGLDSLLSIELRNRLEHTLGMKLSATIIFTYPTIAALSEALVKKLPEAPTNAAPKPIALPPTAIPAAPELSLTPPAQTTAAAPDDPSREPIAIIGMAYRIPAGNQNESFWNLLAAHQDAMVDVQPRWDALWPKPHEVGTSDTRRAALLPGVDQFDAEFFGISPREANKLDPQHRLLLEMGWEAFEHSGHAVSRLPANKTGVFIGLSSHDYEHHVMAAKDQWDAFATIGPTGAFAAGRLSYILGLNGPAFCVDTVCSSALVAVHLACQSLRNGECSVAMAGAVHLLLSPVTMAMYHQLQAMSPSGICRTFDSRADGFVRGEGGGVFILKRLSEAQRDKDRIIAIIRGSAVNQDGHSAGLTAPSARAQTALLRTALQNARLNPSDISYIEAHGTGTALGDPIEVEALQEVYGAPRADGSVCTLGSVKTNVGHLEAAAGIAGLVRVILSLEHELIPGVAHLETLNANISLTNSALRVGPKAVPWPRGAKPRFAGVSAFGMSGTNAHLIIEEGPRGGTEAPITAPAYICKASAKSPHALRHLVNSYAAHLTARGGAALADMCFVANNGREDHAHRAAFVAKDQASMLKALQNFDASAQGAHPSQETLTTAFLFSGQGSQAVGMGKELFVNDAIFRDAIQRCASAFGDALPQPLFDVMFAAANPEILQATGFAQPALFALEYALHCMWSAWGIKTDAVFGHSVGEYTAACVAGILSLEDATRLVAARAKLMQALPAGGAMAAIYAPESDVRPMLQSFPGKVAIAAINGPLNTVISGEGNTVDAIMQQCKLKAIQSKSLRTSHAFHSPLMEPMIDAFRRVAESVKHQGAQIAFVPNLTGKALQPGETLSAEYWCHHLREPVLFWEGMKALSHCDVFVEAGPHPVLCGLGQTALADAHTKTWIPSLHREQPEWQHVLGSVAQLYRLGASIHWPAVQTTGVRSDLPTYPFQRKRYWVSQGAGASSAAAVTEVLENLHVAQRNVHVLLEDLKQAPADVHAEITMRHVREALAEVLGGPEAVPQNPRQPLLEAGLSSLMAIELAQALGRRIDRLLPPTLVIQQPTMHALVRYLLQTLSPQLQGGKPQISAPIASQVPDPPPEFPAFTVAPGGDMMALLEQIEKGTA